ncbi:hypothetical protein [Methylobacterium sp. J-068]|uniref:hypothetical protein n=1 Tax=Methylobacterium sp. J-068 TaxID=2836649 RepID=UPI001FBAA060|nr:hypothetical protein [Methylobacterium sp. J-068]MCJ2034795.1 hypothetical protein [Methylobacterium sp. J-068]
MSTNESEPPHDPVPQRTEAARDGVAEVIEDFFERLVAASRTARTDVDADLRAAGRLMARNTQRQLTANLTLVKGLMEARSIPAMLQRQQDFMQRQAEWAVRDWERMSTQALDLLEEGERVARGEPAMPEPAMPEPAPRTDEPGIDTRESGPAEPGTA